MASAIAAAARTCAVYVWRRRRLRAITLGLLAAGALSIGGFEALRHSSLASVQQVTVSGVRGVPDAHAIETALTAAARQQNTLNVNLATLRAAVAPFRVVRDVKATPSFPHGLHIQVIEQPPVAAVEIGATRTAVAADGVVLGPALLSNSLPTLNGGSSPPRGDHAGAWLAGALAVLGAEPGSIRRLVARAFTGSRGLTLVMRNGLVAYFGDGTRPHAKWLSLALVLASERSAGATYVDVRVPERPTAGFSTGTTLSTLPGGSSSPGASGEHTSLSESTTTALAAALRLANPKGSTEGPPQGAGSPSEATAGPKSAVGPSSAPAGTSSEAPAGTASEASSGSSPEAASGRSATGP